MIEAKDLFDICVTWCTGEMLIYPGDPAPEYGMIWELDKGGIANVGYLRTGIHYATHVDAPWHFTNSGKKMHEVSLDHWIGPAAVLDCTDEPVCVSSDTLRRFDLTGVERVLFKTMNSVDYYHREGFYEKFIYLDKSACEYLVRETPVKTVGIDYITVDPYMCDGFPAHHTLLENGVLIIECIDLRDVEPENINCCVSR
jgi:arylformamidase